MSRPLPYWHPDADYSQTPFFIRRMNTEGSIRTSDIPPASLPMTGFVYLTGGELLAEACGALYHCLPGHILLIPERMPFAIRYYQDARGFAGGFTLGDGTRLPLQPVHQAFWFDEAGFAGELFNMLVQSFEQGREDFIGKAIPLLLSMLDLPAAHRQDERVSHFLEQVFHPDRPLETADTCARASGLTLNGFGRLIHRETGRSPGAWIDLARLGRAKRLLQETDLPVIDIACAVGLDDQSYFARFFRKHSGLTPTAFRKKTKEKHR